MEDSGQLSTLMVYKSGSTTLRLQSLKAEMGAQTWEMGKNFWKRATNILPLRILRKPGSSPSKQQAILKNFKHTQKIKHYNFNFVTLAMPTCPNCRRKTLKRMHRVTVQQAMIPKNRTRNVQRKRSWQNIGLSIVSKRNTEDSILILHQKLVIQAIIMVILMTPLRVAQK